MVSDELRRMYAQIGFDLIPIQEGVNYFLDEICRDEPGSAEVVVSGKRRSRWPGLTWANCFQGRRVPIILPNVT